MKAEPVGGHLDAGYRAVADGQQPWTTSGVSSDLNQAALMAIVDGFDYWLLQNPD